VTASTPPGRRLLDQMTDPLLADLYREQDRLRARIAELQATLDRVRAAVTRLCDDPAPHPGHDHVCPDGVRRYVLAALDDPTQQDTDA
jgi:hypothetical protein